MHPFNQTLFFPYWNIIKYKDMRRQYDPDDLSNPVDYANFVHMLDKINEKVYTSLLNGDRQTLLMVDDRKRVNDHYQYYSIIKDMAWLGDLESYLVKVRYNVTSTRNGYHGSFIPMMHEQLLIFIKRSIWQFGIKYTKTFIRDLRQWQQVTWRDLVRAAVAQHCRQASLQDLYQTLDDAKKANNVHWRE